MVDCIYRGFAEPEGTTLYEQVCTNAKNIEDLTTGEDALEPRVTALETTTAEHDTEIDANTADISANSTAITTNQNNIASNAINIASNSTGIGNNVTAITANAAAITANDADILNLQTDKVDNAFKNIKVAGYGDVVADSKETDIELVAGANVLLTTDPATKKVTIAASGVVGTQAINTSIVDVGGYYSAVEVENALQEVGSKNASQDSNITSLINDVGQNTTDIASNAADITALQNSVAGSSQLINTNTIEIAKAQLETEILGAVATDYSNRYGLKTSPATESRCVQDQFISKFTSDHSAGALTVNVEDTTGLSVGMEVTLQDTLSDSNYENLIVDALTATSITFLTPLTKSYTTANTAVVYRSINGQISSVVESTGNLYALTSNTTPAPFSAFGNATGEPSETDYWQGFDNNTGSDVQFFTGTGGFWGIELGSFYRPLDFSLKFKSATSGTIKIQGRNAADNWVDLWSQAVSATTATYTGTLIDTEVDALRVYWDGADNFHSLYELQITRWKTGSTIDVKEYFKRKKITVSKAVDVIAEQMIIDPTDSPTLEKAVSIQASGSDEIYQNMDLDSTSDDGSLIDYSLFVTTAADNVVTRTKYIKTLAADDDCLVAEYGGVD